MTPEKLYKYKNFKLKSKHIYAKKKLENIMNNILLNKLYGGAVPVEIINTIDTFYDEEIKEMTGKDATEFNPEIMKVTNAFTEQLKTFVSILPSDNDETIQLITSLIDADSILNEEFKNIMKNNQIVDGNTEILLKIQKSLFNLQAKIIFSSLTKIDKVNITPLLEAFHTKFEAMNAYIQAQEDELKKNDSKSNPKISQQKLYNQQTDKIKKSKKRPKTKTNSRLGYGYIKSRLSRSRSDDESVPVPAPAPVPVSVPAPDAKSVTDANSQITTSAKLYDYFNDTTILLTLYLIATSKSIDNVEKLNSDNCSPKYDYNNGIFSDIFNIIVEKYKTHESINKYLNTQEKIDTIRYYLQNTTENICEIINKEDDDEDDDE
jgi:hypothetical protein